MADQAAHEKRIAIGQDDGRAGSGAPASPGAAAAATTEHFLSKRRAAIAAGAALAGVAACWVLAGLVAQSAGGAEESASVAVQGAGVLPPASDYPPAGGGFERSAWRRLHGGDKAPKQCHTAKAGEPCHRHVLWAMKHGLKSAGEVKYPGLTVNSTFEQFQEFLHKDPFATCPMPCTPESSTKAGAASAMAKEAEPTIQTQSGSGLGWEPSGRVVARGQWCAGMEPSSGWALRSCGRRRSAAENVTAENIATQNVTAENVTVKVLTYNLFWWNLFGRRHGNGGSAGRLINSANYPKKFDVMAFQECEGIGWVLGDAGVTADYAAITGPHALCIAYLRSAWDLVADSSQNVAEDRADQWYGTRAGMWVRLRHVATNTTLFFINHHGPLPLHSGGRCGGEATAFNLLELIASQAREDDVVVLVGDFNAGPDSETVRALSPRMHKVFTGTAFGGVDHVFSSCKSNMSSARVLGNGGSDHDAIEAVIQL